MPPHPASSFKALKGTRGTDVNHGNPLASSFLYPSIDCRGKAGHTFIPAVRHQYYKRKERGIVSMGMIALHVPWLLVVGTLLPLYQPSLLSLLLWSTFWCGATGRALDLRSTGRRFKSYSRQKLHNLEQVVHTYVPLSRNSITLYRPRGGYAVRLGR